MRLLHNVGNFPHSNYNTKEQVIRCNEPLSFDGIYESVYQNRDMLKWKPFKTILFVMWGYVGENNEFDAIPNNIPVESYCDWNELMELVMDYNCELASHSWTHRNMTELSDDEVRKELQSPIPCRYFAYPYGNVDERVARLTREAGYQDAFSVNQGNGGPFQRNRSYL